ncbi:MAG TPA: hypothetical protein VHF07_07555 [Nitrospiraceae bacterium]|nr:hypothetical protein [Nitrospiraceae bacterium]
MHTHQWSPAVWIIGMVVVGLQSLLLLKGIEQPAVAQDMKRFQYKIVEVLPDTHTMQATLNEYGQSGWELVAVSMGDMTAPRLVFKK